MALTHARASVFGYRSPRLLGGKPPSGSAPPAGHPGWNLLLLSKEDFQEEAPRCRHGAGTTPHPPLVRGIVWCSLSITSVVSFTCPRQTSPGPAHMSGPSGPCPPYNTPGQPADVRTLAVDSTTRCCLFCNGCCCLCCFQVYHHGPGMVRNNLRERVIVGCHASNPSVCFPAQGPTVHLPPTTTGPVQWNGPPPSPVSKDA